MDPITSIKSITNWVNNYLVQSSYERRVYEKGNPVTKVTRHAIAKLYDKRGKLEQVPKQGNHIDKKI